jgi:hypothetical protein
MKRVDKNHAEIVRALRDVPGVTVFSLATLGKGIPDICVGFRGITVLVEIKGATGKVNPLQAAWHDRWTGSRVVIIRSVDDIPPLIQNMTALVKVFAPAVATAAESSAGLGKDSP